MFRTCSGRGIIQCSQQREYIFRNFDFGDYNEFFYTQISINPPEDPFGIDFSKQNSHTKSIEKPGVKGQMFD